MAKLLQFLRLPKYRPERDERLFELTFTIRRRPHVPPTDTGHAERQDSTRDPASTDRTD